MQMIRGVIILSRLARPILLVITFQPFPTCDIAYVSINVVFFEQQLARSDCLFHYWAGGKDLRRIASRVIARILAIVDQPIRSQNYFSPQALGRLLVFSE